MADEVKVRIVPSKVGVYATAARAHLNAALSYMRVGDKELATIELNKLDLCVGKIRSNIE